MKTIDETKVYKIATFGCACFMSIGSHFAAHTLAPIKDVLKQELGINNTQFGLLQSSILLFQTVTPILGGMLSDEIGTERTSFYATLSIFVGELIMGISTTFLPKSIQFIMLGIGQSLFGLGAGGIVTIQETIMVNTFMDNNLSLAMGSLFAIGKLSGFLASGTVAHLVEWTHFYGSIFWFTTFLALISFILSIIYMYLSKKFKDQKFIQIQQLDNEEYELVENTNGPNVYTEKKSSFKDKLILFYTTLLNFDTLTWYYALILSFSFGAVWTPFLHLASNLILHTYDTTQVIAAWQASICLGLPTVLCPLFGILLDKLNKPQPLFTITAACCILLCFILLDNPLIPSPMPSMILFAISLGCGPLSLATMAPDLLLSNKKEFKVGTLLGLHRAIDHMASSLLDTFLGFAQDHANSVKKDYNEVLTIFQWLAAFNLIFSLAFFWLKTKSLLNFTNVNINWLFMFALVIILTATWFSFFFLLFKN